jgi:hypothetical protein
VISGVAVLVAAIVPAILSEPVLSKHEIMQQQQQLCFAPNRPNNNNSNDNNSNNDNNNCS